MTNTINPIELFKIWLEEERFLSKTQIQTAVCLSTIGIDNFPNARFVSLKGLIDDKFVITGPLNSRKGIEIEKNGRVALTFWWNETERQVRIQGFAEKISDQLADKYFDQRNRISKAVSLICEQGFDIEDVKELIREVHEVVENKDEIKRPKNWSGYMIRPKRIELMQFKRSRFHDRMLFEFQNNQWNMKTIQP